MSDTPKTFQRTYRVDHPGERAGTPQQHAALKAKLTTEAKKDGLDLGDAQVVTRTRRSGHYTDVTLRASVETKPPKD